MASLKNGLQPSLTRLEGREQPGTMFSTGLDGAILAGAFGKEILKASRPALVTTQAPQKIDSTEISLLPAASRPLSVQSNTIKVAEATSVQAIDGLSDQRVFATVADYVRANPGLEQRPGDFDGTRGPNLLNYNGDFDGRNGLANEFNTVVSDARTYDAFRIRGNPTKDCFFSHNLITNVDATAANVHIIGPGNVIGGQPNGGLPTVFQGANLKSTQANTGLSGFGLLEVEHKVCGLGLTFPNGLYWVNVQPIGNGAGRSFNSTTSGLAAAGAGQNGTVTGPTKGGPGISGTSYFDSPYFGAVFQDTDLYFGDAQWDFSTGVCSAPAC